MQVAPLEIFIEHRATVKKSSPTLINSLKAHV